jgi:hypothetical protein
MKEEKSSVENSAGRMAFNKRGLSPRVIWGRVVLEEDDRASAAKEFWLAENCMLDHPPSLVPTQKEYHTSLKPYMHSTTFECLPVKVIICTPKKRKLIKLH